MAQVEQLGPTEHGRPPGPPPAPPTLRTRIGPPTGADQGQTAAGARRMEQAIVRVDPRSVLNLSLGFLWRMVVIGVGLGLLFWVGAYVTGTASSIDNFIQELSGYPSLSVLGFQGLLVALVLGLCFVFGGALVAVLVVVVFNLASDLGGGIKMTVTETELDEGLMGAHSAGAVEDRPSGPRPLTPRDRARGAARRRPVLGANVTSLDAHADTGPAGIVAGPGRRRLGSAPEGTARRPRRRRRAGQSCAPRRAGRRGRHRVHRRDDGRLPRSLGSALDGHDGDTADISWVDEQGRYRTAVVRLGNRSH